MDVAVGAGAGAGPADASTGNANSAATASSAPSTGADDLRNVVGILVLWMWAGWLGQCMEPEHQLLGATRGFVRLVGRTAAPVSSVGGHRLAWSHARLIPGSRGRQTVTHEPLVDHPQRR